MMITKRHITYAASGFALGLVIHLFFYQLGVSALGFFAGDIPPLLLKAFPFSLISALLFFALAHLENRPLRRALILPTALLVIALYLYWPL